MPSRNLCCNLCRELLVSCVLPGLKPICEQHGVRDHVIKQQVQRATAEVRRERIAIVCARDTNGSQTLDAHLHDTWTSSLCVMSCNDIVETKCITSWIIFGEQATSQHLCNVCLQWERIGSGRGDGRYSSASIDWLTDIGRRYKHVFFGCYSDLVVDMVAQFLVLGWRRKRR